MFGFEETIQTRDNLSLDDRQVLVQFPFTQNHRAQDLNRNMPQSFMDAEA